MKGKREADNNFNFKSEKLDELRSRVDAAFDEHGDEAWEQIKGIFTHPKRLLVAALAAVLLVGVITVVRDLSTITGQKAIITNAKKSVANFKLREGMPVGAKVTLRGDKMWEFLDRLFNVALPRVRDFRGISANAFDGRGNYALGIKEQLIFPEIEYDKIDKIRGMDIVMCTTAQTDEEARELLKQIGAPFAGR